MRFAVAKFLAVAVFTSASAVFAEQAGNLILLPAHPTRRTLDDYLKTL